MHKNSLLFLLLFTFLIEGCSPKEQPNTKKEAIEFAKKLEYTIAKRSSNMLDSVFYAPAFAKRIANHSGIKYNSKFVNNVSDAMHNLKWGKDIIRSMGKEGTYEFVRHYEKNQHHHAIFRLFSDEGFNYYDFELVKFNNQVKAVDIYVFSLGEDISKTFANTMNIFEKYEKEKQGN